VSDSPTGRIREALRVARDEGLIALLDRVAPYVGVRVLRLMDQPTDAQVDEPPLPDGCVVAEASLADLDALAELRGATHEREARALGAPPLPVREAHRKLFESGHRCFVVRRGDRIEALNWIARDSIRIPFLACELRLRPDEAYAYDAFVDPGMRGHGLGPFLLVSIARQLAGEGVRRIVGLVRISNRSSRRSLTKAGYRAAGSIVCFRIAGRSLRFGNARVAYRSLAQR